MKIIIVGCGKVGIALTEQLSKEGHDITIIDTDKEVVESLSTKFDVLGMEGNGASYSVQIEAGIGDADLLIAVTGSDELNLLCCLIAKKSSTCHTIARIRNPVYSKDINSIKNELGLAMIINPEFAAAREIARLMRFPSAIKIDTFAKGRVEMLKFKLESGNMLENCRIADIALKLHCDVLVCAIERGDEVIIPNGNVELKAKDLVSVVAAPKKSLEFFRKIGIMTNKVGNSLIVGGGEISYYLTEELLQMGISVTIIEKSQERCDKLSALLPKAIIIHGDGTDQNLLLEEGLLTTESFLALTNFDEENILLSLYAKSVSEAKIITKVNRITFDDVIDSLDLGSIVYPKYVTAENIIRYVRAMQSSLGSNIETLYKLIENKVEALEFIISADAPVIGIPLEKLHLKKNILICSINRSGKIIIPRGQDMMLEGDTVVVVTTETGFGDIKDILE